MADVVDEHMLWLIAILLLAFSAPVSALEFCSGSVRTTCVVDGDTVWLDGEKVRLADLDAPEPRGACVEERVLAARAAGRLADLLAPMDFEIERQGTDRYGRTLAIVTVAGRSVAEYLIDEGLARPWSGRREAWCDQSQAQPGG